MSRRVCLYFVTFGYAANIVLDLFEGESVVCVTQVGEYRNVWIEGTEETRERRFR